MKKLKNLKTTTKYLLLGLYALILPFCHAIGLMLVSLIKNDISPFAILYLTVVIPGSLIFYAILAYILTKQILLPNFIFFLATDIPLTIFSIIVRASSPSAISYRSIIFDVIFEVGVLSLFATAFTLATSIVLKGAAMGAHKSHTYKEKQ